MYVIYMKKKTKYVFVCLHACVRCWTILVMKLICSVVVCLVSFLELNSNTHIVE